MKAFIGILILGALGYLAYNLSSGRDTTDYSVMTSNEFKTYINNNYKEYANDKEKSLQVHWKINFSLTEKEESKKKLAEELIVLDKLAIPEEERNQKKASTNSQVEKTNQEIAAIKENLKYIETSFSLSQDEIKNKSFNQSAKVWSATATTVIIIIIIIMLILALVGG